MGKIVCIIGKPVIGKGVAGRSLEHLYKEKDILRLHVMRNRIKEAAKTNPELARVMEECEQSRALVPGRFINPIITSTGIETEWTKLDGTPRNGHQVHVVNDHFRSCGANKFYLLEFVASDDYVNEAFELTVDAADRQNRLDAKKQTHLDGVALYNKNIDGIRKKSQQLGWKHIRVDGRLPLHRKVGYIIDALKLPNVPEHTLLGLEAALGLKSQHRPALVA